MPCFTWIGESNSTDLAIKEYDCAMFCVPLSASLEVRSLPVAAVGVCLSVCLQELAALLITEREAVDSHHLCHRLRYQQGYSSGGVGGEERLGNTITVSF